MPALTTVVPDAKSLSRADQLRLIQLTARDLADADGPLPSPPQPAGDRPPSIPGPRLADPAQPRDFVKQVREVALDAAG